jgi:CRP-like cAMP-binding protein
VLASLSAAAAARLKPHCEPVTLTLGETVIESKATIDHIYLPQSGVLSFGATRNGNPIEVEVGIVGSEGLAGLPLFLGVPRSASEVTVKASGTAIRMKAKPALAEFWLGGPFQKAILLFAHELFQQVSVNTSCHRHHYVEQRLSRWLLMMHDRVDGNSLQLTRQFLGVTLGVRNQAVSRAAIALQRRGAIHYSRGTIKIINRKKLEAAACACYALVARKTGRAVR